MVPDSPTSANAFCTGLSAVILSSYLPFLSLSPPPPHHEEAEKWGSHSQTLLSVPRLQQFWELEESLLLSNTFAPWVKDKGHHAWLWGWGCPAPHELGGHPRDNPQRSVHSMNRAWKGKFLNFLSLSLDHFSFSPKETGPNRQRHWWQTHNLCLQDWSVPQNYSLSRAASMTQFLPFEKVKIKMTSFTKL